MEEERLDLLEDIRRIAILHHLREDLHSALFIYALLLLDERDERLLHADSDSSGTAHVDLEHRGWSACTAHSAQLLQRALPWRLASTTRRPPLGRARYDYGHDVRHCQDTREKCTHSWT